jgi:excisionase family DNA binding protein
MNMKQLLTVKEAAELLGVKPSTLRSWIWQRRIPYIKLSRSVRIAPEALQEIIANNTIIAEEPLELEISSEDED